MNLTEKMALDCGVKISTPYIDRLFMPVRKDKFIIIDNRCKYQDSEYDYYNEVLELIYPYLEDNDIDVFQFATDKNKKLNCSRCFITINKKQEAYLISKAQLVIANENYSTLLASTFNVKSIGLYSTYNAKNISPVWNKKSHIILESNRDGNKPTYNSFQEKPKTINFISPFVIAKNILDSLGIDNNLSRYELVNLGESYNQKIIEVVPDFTSNIEFLKDKQINLRLDYVDSLNISVFNYWINNRKINLITNKDINLKLILPFKNNIILITVIASENISENFLKSCKALGFNVKIFCNNKDKLSYYRFKFLDWKVLQDFDDDKNLKQFSNINPNSRFVSSKTLLSKGKQFSCRAYHLLQKPLDKTEERVIFSKEFEEELEFFKIYNEREESTSSASVA